MQTMSLVEEYARGGELVRAATAGLNREQALSRPVPGKWSTLEVVCHLADFEIVFADRLKRVIAEHEPTLMGGDENLFARRLAYHSRDLDEELRLIEACRASTARILRTLQEADFARLGRHSEAGPLTLQDLLQRATNHVTHHVQFIHEKRRALGL